VILTNSPHQHQPGNALVSSQSINQSIHLYFRREPIETATQKTKKSKSKKVKAHSSNLSIRLFSFLCVSSFVT